jgi:hypothetical protein
VQWRGRLETGNGKLGLGAVAQLGERLVCNQEATGSIPVSSTNSMLGVKAKTDSVSRFANCCLAPNIGLEPSDER